MRAWGGRWATDTPEARARRTRRVIEHFDRRTEHLADGIEGRIEANEEVETIRRARRGDA